MTFSRTRRLVLGLALLGAAGTCAGAEWQLDQAASRIEFRAYYQEQPAPGHYREFDARLSFDPARPEEGRVEVTVALASFDMGSREIEEAVRAPEWLDLARFAQARFTSRDIRREAANRYVAHGTLSLKGVERAIAVPFQWQPAGAGARMTGEMTLDRTAFGIGSGEWASGDTIGLQIDVMFDLRLVPAG